MKEISTKTDVFSISIIFLDILWMLGGYDMFNNTNRNQSKVDYIVHYL